MWTVHRSPKLGSIPRYSKDSQVFGPESKGRDTSLQSRCSRAVYDSSTGEILKTSSAEFGLYAEAEKYLKVCLDWAEWNGFNMVARVLEVAEILLFLETPSSFLSFFLRMLRSLGVRLLLLDAWWPATGAGFQWCQCVTVPQRDREKVWTTHVDTEWQRSLTLEREERFLWGKSTMCSVGRGGFFPTALIFPSSLDSPPPASSLFNTPICEQTHLVLILGIKPTRVREGIR